MSHPDSLTTRLTSLNNLAEIAYKEAASLAPGDPLPLSNMSSVKFELGQFSAAIGFINESLALTPEGTDDVTTKRRRETLYSRLIKCYLHESRYDAAKQVLDQITDQNLKSSIHATLDGVSAWTKGRDAGAHRSLALERVPRFKPYLQDVPESFSMGHDRAECLLDLAISKSCSAEDSLSFLLCGSGDSRNLFKTILT